MSQEQTAGGAGATARGAITFIYSSDLDAAHAFYGGALGLPLRADKGVARFYALPGGANSLGVVKEGVSA